ALLGLPDFAPKAMRLIYLFTNGGPSQIDLLDYKPNLEKIYDTDLPDSIRMGQRLTTMTSGQSRFPIAPSDRKSTRLNSSHVANSYAVFCLKKKPDSLIAPCPKNQSALHDLASAIGRSRTPPGNQPAELQPATYAAPAVCSAHPAGPAAYVV